MTRRTSRKYSVLVRLQLFALTQMFVASAAAGATIEKLDVIQHSDSYQLSGQANLAAAPKDVYMALIDFPDLPKLNSNVRISIVLKVINAHSQLVYTETKGCIFIFCHTIKQVQQFTELDPFDIVAVTIPGIGNVKQGRSIWHLQPDGTGTLVTWVSICEPAFWVPPFIGARALEAQLRRQALASLQTIEHLAQERSVPIP